MLDEHNATNNATTDITVRLITKHNWPAPAVMAETFTSPASAAAGDKVFFDMIRKITDSVQKLSENDPDILAVYLLGSAVREATRADSDIDLGIMPEPGVKMSSLMRTKLGSALSWELGRTVDLGEVSSRNLVYAREALLKGRILYQKNQERTNLCRANLLGLYIQFNLDRREVINAYRAG